MSIKRIGITSVSAIAGYTISNLVLNSMNIQPADSTWGVGAFELIEAAIIAAAVLAGNSIL
jgi:hypothetical protein